MPDKTSVEKKKRGRKPNPPGQKKVPKKRGRKPKIKVPTEKKIPKKRGRKPQNKSYGYKNKDISPNPIIDDNIIIHLPIKNLQNELTKISNLLNNYPQLGGPVPYSEDERLSFLKNNNIDSKKIPPTEPREIQINIDVNNIKHENEWYIKDPEMKILEIKNEREVELENIARDIKENSLLPTLIQYKENSEWPENTKISCWWCTCQFKNRPCGLPVNYMNGTYNLVGNFCSPECAAAYNFNDINNTEIWEKYALLNLMYTEVYKDNIKLAPPRNTLKKFGGCLTIDQFRNNNVNNNCEFKIIIPPIKSIIPQIEYSNNNKGFSSTATSTVSYKLKRSKPYNTNTLENCMKIIKK